ncbi:MAG: cation-transporting P-type ATPase [Pseudomonadota bacterium]
MPDSHTLTPESLAAATTEPPVWARPLAETLALLGSDPATGLARAEVPARRRAFGPNVLQRHKARSALAILLDQFRSLIIGLLLVAVIVALLFGERLEAVAIAIVIALNSAIGFVTELRATRSMEALFALTRIVTRVRRAGRVVEVAADELVPGDIVVLEGGDVVAADLRIVSASKLQADESTFTGESLPVDKTKSECAAAAPLPERRCMLFKGTSITRGSGEAVVVGTGMRTELGAISRLVATATKEATPLEQRLNRLGHRLIGVAAAVTLLVTAIGIVNGLGPFAMVQTGLALAVAAIPEGLPVVATIALARGVRRMASRHALINRLSAVETLGATGVICSDKTGTLTENRLTVQRFVLGDRDYAVDLADRDSAYRIDDRPLDAAADPLLQRALEVAVLCNNAALDGDGQDAAAVGDPIEVALLRAAVAAGLNQDAVTERLPEIGEVAFDPQIRMMATVHREADGGCLIAVKGAPEPVIAACVDAWTAAGRTPLCDDEREAWQALNDRLACQGLRLLALAERHAQKPPQEPYEQLTLIGLVALLDPPRREVGAAIAECRRAGINVVVITGDQPATVRTVAHDIGLVSAADEPVVTGERIASPELLSAAERRELLATRLFARVDPAQKLDLITLYQDSGEVVAMTGDGVNDAPALRKADIGIAMGRRGTQVAQEAADMVLQDDNFSTIVTAVAEGRTIFGNIRTFVVYLLSCNVSEVMVVGFASLLGTTIPITPLQILFLNLVTDVFPALALGVGRGDPQQMRQPPRAPAEPIVPARLWLAIALHGLAITVSVMLALTVASHVLALAPSDCITVSFLTLTLAQLWHVFNMRPAAAARCRNAITANPYVWGATALCLAIVAAALVLTPLKLALDIRMPDLRSWGLILACSALPLVAGQIGLEIVRRRRYRDVSQRSAAAPR